MANNTNVKGKLVDYLSAKGSRKLLNINYDSFEISESHSSQINVTVSDNISDFLTEDNNLSFVVSRSLITNPDKLFEISVSAKITIYVKDELVGNVPWDKFDIPQELIRDCPNSFADAYNRFSLLIANITSSFTGVPIVTPNVFLL
jgi:hypothetical protein